MYTAVCRGVNSGYNPPGILSSATSCFLLPMVVRAMKLTLAKPSEAQGKRLLMEAALRLASQTRSIQALGIREIGREAGLNPNTFYRHFKNLDELGVAIIDSIVQELRQPLRDLRQKAAGSVGEKRGAAGFMGLDMERTRRVTHETVKLFFDYVEEHPEAFILGVCELHGASQVLRATLRQAMKDFSTDMADDIRALGVLPKMDDATLLQATSIITSQLFQLSMDYIEYPAQRAAIRGQAESLILMLTAGGTVLQAAGAAAMLASPPKG